MTWFYQHAMMVARSSGAGRSVNPQCALTEERQAYGEGHQKALQISVHMLPLVGFSRREGAIFLPGFRHKRNAWYLFMNAFAALWLGARSSSHTTAVQEGM
jgi:hypothetical protein